MNSYFTGDMLIFTSDGNKYLSELKIGDLVLDKDGIYHPVTNIMTKESDKIYFMKSYGNHGIKMSFDSVIPVKPRKKINSYKQDISTNIGYIKVGQYVASTAPINNYNKDFPQEFTKNNSNFIKFLGLYLLTGGLITRPRKNSSSYDKKVIIYSNKKLEKKYERIFNKLGMKYYKQYSKIADSITFLFPNARLHDYLALEFGDNRKETHLNSKIFIMNKELKKDFLESCQLCSSYNYDMDIYTFTSPSKKLIYDLKELFMDIVKYPIKVNLGKVRKAIVNNKEFLKSESFWLRYKNNYGVADHAYIEKNRFWQPIREITIIEDNKELLYGIEVSNSDNIIINSIVVNN